MNHVDNRIKEECVELLEIGLSYHKISKRLKIPKKLIKEIDKNREHVKRLKNLQFSY